MVKVSINGDLAKCQITNLSTHLLAHSLSTTSKLIAAMVGRAKSDTKKAQIAREAYEDLKAQAIKVYAAERAKPKGRSARTVAKDFVQLYKRETGKDVKLCYNTLIRGANRRRSRAEANASRSWLSNVETDIVIEYIIELGNRGFPLSHRRLKEHVDEILRKRLDKHFLALGVGKQWTHRFVEKHSNHIKMSWSTPLETKRGRAVNPHTIKAWFDILHETVEKYGITADITFGSDEIGSSPADGRKERVMGSRKPAPQYQQRDGSRENITVIVTICADGTAIPPAVILKGQCYQVKWKQDNPAHAA